MLKKLFMAAALAAVCIPTNAQLLVQEYKSPGEANPISPCVFCADPTAIDYNGRVYVYGSNDNQQYIKNGKTGGNGYGDIKSIVVFSGWEAILISTFPFSSSVPLGTARAYTNIASVERGSVSSKIRRELFTALLLPALLTAEAA